MGKQLAFYATPSDEAAFVDEITSRLGGRFIRHAFQKPEEMIVPSLPVVEGVPPRNVEFLLYRPSFKDSLVIKSYETGVHAISTGDSLIIQLSRSHIMGPVLFDGRLWYEPCRDDGIEKPEEFISWTAQIFSWISSQFEFRQERSRSYFVGPDAAARLQKGELKLA